ncbi:MAG: zinc-ribbon domain-containing protein [Candidatus Altiarchaeota archaeon]|nr:zinc-ribbon domain-containing protein [Candidatus Altiarchaeota archaeon]
MKCPKCGEEIEEGDKFCGECGEPVYTRQSELTAEPVAKGKSASNLRVVAGVVIIAFVILFIFSISGRGPTGGVITPGPTGGVITPGPTGGVITPYCRQVAYQEEQCEQVPYLDLVCRNENLDYIKETTKCEVGGFANWIYLECKVTNLDSEGGYFNVRTTFWIAGEEYPKDHGEYIQSKSSKTFKYDRGIGWGDASRCDCSVISPIPTRRVCENVLKERRECKTVTKYREVCS